MQLDSISTVERSHRLVLGARVGAVPVGIESTLLGSGRIFEYWAHMACLVPIEDYHLAKRRMLDAATRAWYEPIIDREPGLADRILGEIRERGPLGSRHFEGGTSGPWWGWKPSKRMLEALWTAGTLAIAGRQGFQRLYDLAERVIPEPHLSAPVPSEASFLRELALRAVRARGALTEAGIVEHNRLGGGLKRMSPHVRALEQEGLLRRLAVGDSGPPVLVAGEADLDRAIPAGGVLLSPFDNLLWDRPFARRLFGFHHVIEVYKREHERVYGYYVLPFLLGDRIVGRADLKADRGEGVLRVRSFHPEPKVRASGRLDIALDAALARLARTIGLERVAR